MILITIQNEINKPIEFGDLDVGEACIILSSYNDDISVIRKVRCPINTANDLIQAFNETTGELVCIGPATLVIPCDLIIQAVNSRSK
mgnify:CR=1 FL=1